MIGKMAELARRAPRGSEGGSPRGLVWECVLRGHPNGTRITVGSHTVAGQTDIDLD